MSSILDMLAGQLGGDTMKQISRHIGADEKSTGAATDAALQALLGAVSRNAATPQGAESLHRALEKDHDGSILDNLGALVGGQAQGRAADGNGILKHLLGNKRSRVETGLSQSTGLDGQSMGKLMAMLAPMVMGALGAIGAGLKALDIPHGEGALEAAAEVMARH